MSHFCRDKKLAASRPTYDQRLTIYDSLVVEARRDPAIYGQGGAGDPLRLIRGEEERTIRNVYRLT